VRTKTYKKHKTNKIFVTGISNKTIPFDHIEITKHRGSLINDFPGVWKCGQARSFVFKTCSQKKLKLRIKWRNKIVKIDHNKDQIKKKIKKIK